jgi:hypothetical protein
MCMLIPTSFICKKKTLMFPSTVCFYRCKKKICYKQNKISSPFPDPLHNSFPSGRHSCGVMLSVYHTRHTCFSLAVTVHTKLLYQHFIHLFDKHAQFPGISAAQHIALYTKDSKVKYIYITSIRRKLKSRENYSLSVSPV